MSAHRQNYTPERPRTEQVANVALAMVIGVAIALLFVHWSLQ